MLDNRIMAIRVAKPNGCYNNIKARLNSYFLWYKGAKEAYRELLNILRELTSTEVKNETVSRVDFAIDIAGVNSILNNEKLVRDNLIHKANNENLFLKDKKYNGIRVGTKDACIKARIYNKSKELSGNKNKELLMKQVWNNYEGDVWRVEYELHRKKLKRFNIKSFSDLEDYAPGLWEYLTTEWLSLRECDNNNTSRRTVMSFWQELVVDEGIDSLADMFNGKKDLDETQIFESDVKSLENQYKGVLTTIGAIEGFNFEDLITYLDKSVKNQKFKKKYEREVQNKKPKYLKISD